MQVPLMRHNRTEDHMICLSSAMQLSITVSVACNATEQRSFCAVLSMYHARLLHASMHRQSAVLDRNLHLTLRVDWPHEASALTFHNAMTNKMP